MPLRVSHVCLRSSLLAAGNALQALGRDDEARAEYSKALPILEKEPRSARLDSERASFYVNIANTYSRQGEVNKAEEYYAKAEKLGQDHWDAGNQVDGMGVVVVSKRARALCYNRNNREEDGKELMREVLKMQLELDVEVKKHKVVMKELEAKQKAEDDEKAKKAEVEAEAKRIAAEGSDPANSLN